MRAFLSLTLLCAFLLNAANAPAQKREREAGRIGLHQVQKIYIGDMGSIDSAERFRLVLEGELIKKGFRVVDQEDSADALLVGVLSQPQFDGDERDARITVQLRLPDGERLWSGNFGPKFSSVFRLKDPLLLRAEEVSHRLRTDWEKAAKNSGAKHKP